MKEEKRVNLLVSYLQYHRKSVFLFSAFIFVFAVVFSLYDLPVEAVAYGVLLCFCILLAVTALDFWQFVKRHKQLTELKNNIVYSIENLPDVRVLLERDYQELIAVVHKDKMRIISAGDHARDEMVDYYTLWAHQIKTPIAAMRLLLQSKEDKESSELEGELFKIEQYVEMVLQYLRLENLSSDLVLKQYDLDDMVRQAVRKYAKIFIRKKISLDFSTLNCQVLTDEKWMVFVIEQILSNALKYTNTGKISIYMEDRKKKVLVIEDTGIGIADGDLPRVFEKGFTGYNGRTDKKSTGIGLYLCKKILRKLSHRITIESKVGVGTKVKLRMDMAHISIE